MNISALDVSASDAVRRQIEDTKAQTYAELHAIEQLKLAINLTKRELEKTQAHVLALEKER